MNHQRIGGTTNFFQVDRLEYKFFRVIKIIYLSLFIILVDGPCLRIIFGDSKQIVQSILAKDNDDRFKEEDDRPMLIVTNEAKLNPANNSLKNPLKVWDFCY